MRATTLLLVALLAALSAAIACVPKQRIPLHVDPPGATLYVDGEELETTPEELDLRSDRAHVLYFKSEGYRPERVVLEARERDGELMLEPERVSVRLHRIEQTVRDVEIEMRE